MGRHLIIPDIHQDLFFIRDILVREKIEDFDQVVLLGDYFDAYRPECSGAEMTVMTARFLMELRTQCGKRLRMLWGNHDLPYYSRRDAAWSADGLEDSLVTGNFDRPVRAEQSSRVNEVWRGEIWKGLELAIFCDGWLLSHAGFHPQLWPGGSDPDAALQAIKDEWETALANLPQSIDHPLFQAGPARAGNGVVGGPVWLDWELEFRDALPFPQIVGHSRDDHPRRRGQSWCIDCGQTAYAVLNDGELEIRELSSPVQA